LDLRGRRISPRLYLQCIYPRRDTGMWLKGSTRFSSRCVLVRRKRQKSSKITSSRVNPEAPSVSAQKQLDACKSLSHPALREIRNVIRTWVLRAEKTVSLSSLFPFFPRLTRTWHQLCRSTGPCTRGSTLCEQNRRRHGFHTRSRSILCRLRRAA